MEIQDHVLHTENSLSLSLEILTLKVEENLFAFHRQVQLQTREQSSLFLTNPSLLSINPNEHGFVDESNLGKLLSHQPFEQKNLVILSPKELQAYRTSHDFSQVIPNHTELQKRNPVSWLQQEGFGPDNVIQEPEHINFLFDRHGQPLPTCVMLDFIETYVSEQSHDVNAVVRLLLAHSDIRVLHRNATDFELLATSVEEAISLSDPDSHTDICFYWHPSNEQFTQAWKRAQQIQSYKPIHAMGQAFMDLDFCGLSVARR